MKSFRQLNEKLILINNGKKYGQIVFLAGGAGSGKGFALTNFMEGEKFKVRDVDEWKKTFMNISKLTGKYPELKGLDLKKPEDVGTLHKFIVKKGIKDKSMTAMLSQMKNKETLPNLMFDMTFNDIKKVKKMLPDLLRAGYSPANIHVVWVLQKYEIALKQNKGRERVVPDDIMFSTHEGAGQTLYDLLAGKSKALVQVNGSIYVILNNPKNTIFFKNEKDKVKKVIKDFKYLTLKKRGKPMLKQHIVMKELFFWIMQSIPKGELLKTMKKLSSNEEK
jgi:uncharacterized C2H2 Zn-finger protein